MPAQAGIQDSLIILDLP